MGHRLVPVLEVVQLLAVAGHEEKCVVDAGTEDEHAEDAGALVVDGEVAVLREEVDDALRREHRADAAQEEQDRELEAAVGDQQDHEDDGESGQQQDPVDARERLHLVGCNRGGTGDAHVEPVRTAGGPLEVVADVRQDLPAVGPNAEGDDGLQCPSVLRQDGPDDLAAHLVEVAELLGVRGSLRGVGPGDAGLALVQDEGGDGVRVGEGAGLVDDLRGLGFAREP
jgi:hypothetical protein